MKSYYPPFVGRNELPIFTKTRKPLSKILIKNRVNHRDKFICQDWEFYWQHTVDYVVSYLYTEKTAKTPQNVHIFELICQCALKKLLCVCYWFIATQRHSAEESDATLITTITQFLFCLFPAHWKTCKNAAKFLHFLTDLPLCPKNIAPHAATGSSPCGIT